MTYEYEPVITPSSGLRLHLNENTAGCSPKVLSAIHALTREQAAFYPDYEEAIGAVASRLGVREEEVLLTNGLDEGILAAAVVATRARSPRAAAAVSIGSAGDSTPEAIVIVPAFYMYAACAEAAGARIVEVPLQRDFSFPLEGVLEAIGPNTRLMFLTNPNNPTGGSIPREDILRLARAAPDAMVFLDEAYADFSGETLIGDSEARNLPNLVVGRTFAKAYGLAALRAGAVVAQPATLTPLRRVVPPFSLNICAAVALTVGMSDTEYYNWYLEQVRASKALLYATFDRLRVRYWPSAANFVLADFGDDARRVVEGLASRQVFVRDRSSDPACPGCVRITAGVLEHTEAGLRALEEVLCGVA
jgi:histidinol-phosphate aminotransferase